MSVLVFDHGLACAENQAFSLLYQSQRSTMLNEDCAVVRRILCRQQLIKQPCHLHAIWVHLAEDLSSLTVILTP